MGTPWRRGSSPPAMTACLCPAGGCQRLLAEDFDEGVELRVEGFDALQEGRDDLDRRELPLSDRPCEFQP
jgi:hypothetical protein